MTSSVACVITSKIMASFVWDYVTKFIKKNDDDNTYGRRCNQNHCQNHKCTDGSTSVL